ncbi:Serine protease 30 [Gracilariopsis chorda]|uniref:Serine protease 30 n=1 Tax=Gracilariopsis chorda TaxID=448386 RepID=A0A2V3IG52_9FLOR|nr:Serine protease 30 [Gracilariopsis chorda]|eukprot:PXF41054.1 Serine protease 30 [Gracilariopsis chorda]
MQEGNAQEIRRPFIQNHGRIADISEVNEFSQIPLIIGGKKVPKKLLKSMARIVVEREDGFLSSCTGSVVSRNYVLCAAHCFVLPSKALVRRSYVLVGEPSTKIKYFESPQNKYFVRNVWIHRKYKDNSLFKHDVALIQLQKKIDKKLYKPMALGAAPDEGRSKLTAAGYGVKGSNKGEPKRARRASVLYQEWDTCNEEAGYPIANSEKSEICYTSLKFPNKGKTGTCFGDSGGPITKKENGEYIQVGITSFFVGDLCESPGAIFVAQRVENYLKQINRKVKKNQSKGWKRL